MLWLKFTQWFFKRSKNHEMFPNRQMTDRLTVRWYDRQTIRNSGELKTIEITWCKHTLIGVFIKYLLKTVKYTTSYISFPLSCPHVTVPGSLHHSPQHSLFKLSLHLRIKNSDKIRVLSIASWWYLLNLYQNGRSRHSPTIQACTAKLIILWLWQ